MASEFPPKVFGGLMAVLGLLLAAAGWQMDSLGGGDRYYIVLGLLLLLSGVLFYQGSRKALWAYGLTLAVVWIWSLQTVGFDVNALIPRIGLVTLVAFYVYSYRIKSRLG